MKRVRTGGEDREVDGGLLNLQSLNTNKRRERGVKVEVGLDIRFNRETLFESSTGLTGVRYGTIENLWGE